MKSYLSQGLLLLTLLPACSTSSKDADTLATDEIAVMIPDQTCYTGVIGKDSIFLQTEVFPTVVTGTLQYKNYEKDSSTGQIEGEMKGDTLLADYTFMSEGVESVAQVIFLVKGDTVLEGYGEMEEKDGKMVFKDPGRISFDSSVKLNKTECRR